MSPHPPATAVDLEQSGGDHEPVSTVAKRRHVSAIWLVPIVAGVVVAYLGYGALARRGPEITLRFQTAQGILAQQTVVKYKAVPIGTVEDVDLAPDHGGVVVHVRMQREAKFALTDHARFWVVRPRLTLESLSALETIVTGAYVSVDPGAPGGRSRRAFVGLEEPPGVTSDEPGKMFQLKAARIGSLSDGAPVFYRDVTVGSLISHDLGDGLGPVSLRVFVRSPYDKLVQADTIFWNASGISVHMGADGLHVELESIPALLTGGIAFKTRAGNAPEPVADGTPPFHLYESKATADTALFDQNTACVTYFQGSVQGLAQGSVVQMFGVPIGAVTDVRLAKDPRGRHFVARVAFNLQPARAFAPDDYHLVSSDEVRALVAQGLRVVLDTSSLLTGEKVLSLEYVPGSTATPVTMEAGALVLPSQPGGFDGLMRAANDIAAKLNHIPFEDIGKNLDESLRAIAATAGSPDLRSAIASLSATMKDARHLVREADTDLTPALQRLPVIAGELQGAVEHARKALGSAGYGANSDVQRGLARMIDQVGDAARTVRLLADFLDHHPEALIEGRAKHAEGR